ncbi:LysR family transcriptional regulator, partial [Corynebacterium appendicis]|uniref:LysR family transcriptional regulator n=1 Tax=Corynebacterium appendicis TaxID=163202 RepID=UPI00223B56DF
PSPRTQTIGHPRQIQVFRAIVEHGSTNAAASALGISQSSVSSQLARLEHEIGATLFDRSGTGSKLTEAGKAFAQRAPQIMTLAQTMIEEAQAAARRPIEGVLRIGGTITTSMKALPNAVKSFIDLNPNVDVDLVIENTASIRSKVASGVLPQAIIAAPTDDLGTLASITIGEASHSLIISPQHLLAHSLVRPNELRWSRALLREPGSATYQSQYEFLEKISIPRLQTSTISSDQSIIAAVEAGLGFSLLPTPAVEYSLKAGSVASFSTDFPLPKRSIQYVYSPNHTMTALENAFRAHILSRKDNLK